MVERSRSWWFLFSFDVEDNNYYKQRTEEEEVLVMWKPEKDSAQYG